jgi:hypothetical protein
MMSDKVDALFAGEPPIPSSGADDRVATIRGVLKVAIPLVILGIPCWTSVPGAMLTLWAWLATDAQMSRSEAENASDDVIQSLVRLRRLSTYALGLCVVTLIIQIILLSTTLYERFWSSVIVAIDAFI